MAQQAGPRWLTWLSRRLPLSWFEWYVSHGVDWLVMTEDLPHAANRVTLDPRGRIRLHYTPSNRRAHRQLVSLTKRMLRPLGLRFYTPDISFGASNTTHQCGTVVFGSDPRISVLDPFCRAHDVSNLFVVDASFFPSSAAVNPGLTIIAQALRVADHIKETELT
jgi:choline dehydrogenase-like flavoprotein